MEPRTSLKVNPPTMHWPQRLASTLSLTFIQQVSTRYPLWIYKVGHHSLLHAVEKKQTVIAPARWLISWKCLLHKSDDLSQIPWWMERTDSWILFSTTLAPWHAWALHSLTHTTHTWYTQVIKKKIIRSSKEKARKHHMYTEMIWGKLVEQGTGETILPT